jgi:Rrf2 family nitric oxide-sensitive transcriptional repressor
MRLSLFTDYSLRVLMFGALKAESFSLSEIAEAYGISRNHLVKVVNHLAKLGYLETKRGRGGGIGLGMPASEIRLGLLVRRTENAPVLVECFDPKSNTCCINGACRLKGILARAASAFYDELDRHTVADLVDGPGRKHLINQLFTPRDETAPATR